MNATKWRNLTEFITFLGISGICRVENTEKGWFISWIDTSPEAMKKRDANVKRQNMEKGEADREDRLIKEQVERARQAALEQQLESAVSNDESPNSGSDHGSTEPESKMDIDTDDRSGEETVAPTSVAPLTIQKSVLKKPVIAAPTLIKSTNPLKSSNPLATKKSDNPLKSSMKEKKEETPVNNNGKRPLPKAVEIMNEELARKKFREQKQNSRDDQYKFEYERSREVYVGRR
jgi:DNA/RNA-binding protein KIN17